MQEIIVYIIIALAVGAIVRYVYRQARGKGSHCHCESCPHSGKKECHCHEVEGS